MDNLKRTITCGRSAIVATAAAACVLITHNARADADTDGVLKIGAPLALTGALADEGKKQEDVWTLWLERVTADGGITVDGEPVPVEFVSYDYQTDGKRAGQLAEKLIIDDEVDILMAPFGSGHTKIVAAVAERYRTPMIACVASSESVYDQGFRYLFGTLAPNDGITESMAGYFTGNMPDISTVAIYGRDDVFPRAMANAMATTAEAAGLEVVYDQLYSVGTMDHSSAVSAMKSAEPDWIYMTGYTQDLILGRKQLSDLGVTAPIITMITGPAYREFTEALGPLADGVTSSTWWHHASNYTDAVGPWSTTEQFYEDFRETYGSDPDYVHASCAAAADVLVNAVQTAGSTDKTSVRDALAETDIMTFYGPISFGDNGMNEGRDLPVIQVQDDEIKVLFPETIADADLISAD